MGADYYANAIIGIKLPEKDDIPPAKIYVRKRAFSHSFEDNGNMEFHPKTGKKLWLEEKEEVEADYPSLIIDVGDDYLGSKPEPGQKIISIPDGLSTAYGTDQRSWFIGFVVETGSSNGGDEEVFDHLPDIDALKNRLKNFLEPLGYWNEEEFGLYSVLYCSY